MITIVSDFKEHSSWYIMGFIKKLIYGAGIIGCLAMADYYNIPSRMIDYYSSKKDSLLPSPKEAEKGNIKDIVDGIECKDSIFYYISSDKDISPEKKVDYIGTYYQNLSPREKWLTAKEIAKKSIK